MMRVLSFLIFAAGLGALFGVVWWLRVREPQAAPDAARPPFVLPVTVAEVRRGTVEPKVLLTGNVRSVERASIGFEVGGLLVEVLVDEGAVVARGDALARLDDRDAKAARDRADASRLLAQRELERLLAGEREEVKRRLAAEVEAERAALELSERELERGRELADERIISPSQLDLLDTTRRAAQNRLAAKEQELAEAEAGTRVEDIEVARAQLAVRAAELAEAELALAKTVLGAPFDGVVTRRWPSTGDPVAARSTVFELVDLARREIVVEIPSRYAARLSAGAAIEVTTEDLPGFELVTRLDALIPVAETASGNMRGLAYLGPDADPDGLLAPGVFVRLRLALDPIRDALIVPADALRVTGDGTIVVRVDPARAPAQSGDGGGDSSAPTASWVAVRKLGADGGDVAIAVLDQGGGLAAGDQVVVTGVDRAFPGAPLSIAEPQVVGDTAATGTQPEAPGEGGAATPASDDDVQTASYGDAGSEP